MWLTNHKIRLIIAKVAQLVERNLAKVEVASSRLVFRSKPFRTERAFVLPRMFVLAQHIEGKNVFMPGWCLPAGSHVESPYKDMCYWLYITTFKGGSQAGNW